MVLGPLLPHLVQPCDSNIRDSSALSPELPLSFLAFPPMFVSRFISVVFGLAIYSVETVRFCGPLCSVVRVGVNLVLSSISVIAYSSTY